MRLLLDAHFDPAVARTLRERGHDVMAAVDLGPEVYQASDAELLEFAAAKSRALVTRNVRDFVLLQAEWLAQERSHAGIILVHTRTIPQGERGAGSRALERLLRQPPAVDLPDSLVWVRPAPGPGGGPGEEG